MRPGFGVIDSYDGEHDAYGNELHVTAVAIADELASAADLVKRKLAGRPVAVIRGLAYVVLGAEPGTARDLLRPGTEDLFRMGVRESVIHALLVALGREADYERMVRIEDPAALQTAITDGLDLEPGQLRLVMAMLASVAHPS